MRYTKDASVAKFRTAWLTLAVACGFVSCGPSWTMLKRSEDGFSLALPGAVTCKPHEETRTTSGTLAGETCSAEYSGRGISVLYGSTFGVSWDQLSGELETMSVNEVTKILLSRAPPDAQPLSSRPLMLDGVAAVEYEWRVEPTTEQAEKAPPGYRFTTRRRYAVRDGRMYAIWVMGTLDAGQEKAWARVVESFTFFQRSSPLSPP